MKFVQLSFFAHTKDAIFGGCVSLSYAGAVGAQKCSFPSASVQVSAWSSFVRSVSDGYIRLSSLALVHSSIRGGSRHSNDPPDDRVSMDTDVLSASPSADMQLDIPAHSGLAEPFYFSMKCVSWNCRWVW